MTEQQQHPITPPPELVREWWAQETYDPFGGDVSNLATQAARWGADQDLEACVEWLPSDLTINGESLRDARRPEPPSLAEEAQRILVENGATLDGRVELDPEDVSIIRAALERLQDLEKGNE